jgi:hypothetical protein
MVTRNCRHSQSSSVLVPGMEAVKEPGHLKGTDFLRWVSLVRY